MEESIGFLSVIPPIIVVALAIITKNVLLSLLLGVSFGLFLSMAVPGSPTEALTGLIPEGVRLVTDVLCNGDNMHLLIFLALLGGLIAVLTVSGCAGAFSALAVRRIRSRTHAQLMTLLLGCVIFIDDYFNAITVGNVMVPITDKFKISRAKLAYIIDSTSAPVTVLMPISSWVATVISLVVPAMAANGFASGGMSVFLRSCLYNYYAWLTLLMVFLVIVKKFDIGPMAAFEKILAETGEDISIYIDVNESVIDSMADGRRGTARDLITIIAALVALSLAFMVIDGGILCGATLTEAFMCCDTMLALVYAAVCTLLLSFVMFVVSGKMTLKQFDKAFQQGIRSMVSAMCVLILSWTFSEVLGDGALGTGRYVAAAVGGWLPAWLMPAVIFLISAVIAFTTGASWGAMTIMLPTSIAICAAIEPKYVYAVIGATLSGTVFGDHCSPVSDTTVLSSSGAGCRHIDHVTSQIIYAIIVAAVSALAFAAAGITASALVGLAVGVCLTTAVVFAGAARRKGKGGK